MNNKKNNSPVNENDNSNDSVENSNDSVENSNSSWKKQVDETQLATERQTTTPRNKRNENESENEVVNKLRSRFTKPSSGVQQQTEQLASESSKTTDQARSSLWKRVKKDDFPNPSESTKNSASIPTMPKP